VILVDDRSKDYDLIPEVGLSIYLELNENAILFDVNSSWGIVEENARKLGVELSRVNAIVISHWHEDHVGGLRGAMYYFKYELRKNIPIYSPIEVDLENVIVTYKGMKIMEHIYSTGPLGYIVKEQSLVIDTPQGSLIIIGCNHPGLELVVNTALEITKSKVFGIIGGLHIDDDEDINKVLHIIKTFDIEIVGPAHCTSNNALKVLSCKLKHNLIDMYTGRVLVLEF